MLRSTLAWPAPPVTLASQGVTLSFSSHLVPGTRNLFVTKWVHIKHYGLKLGGPFSKSLSASFSCPEILEIIKQVPEILGRVISEKKKAPARQPRVVVRMGFYQKSLLSRFWMKRSSQPQRWNDQKWCQTSYLPIGMPQTYYFIMKIWKSRKWVKSGPWWPYFGGP